MTDGIGGFLLSGVNMLDITRSEIDIKRSETAAKEAVERQRKFEEILSEKRDTGENDKKLLDACYGMETLFIDNLLKSMRKTIPESDFFGKSLAKDIFRDMLYNEYAKVAAKSDQFGLAKQIYEQLSAQNTP